MSVGAGGSVAVGVIVGAAVLAAVAAGAVGTGGIVGAAVGI